MYSEIQLPLKRSEKFLLWIAIQFALWYWVIYIPNRSISFLLATICLPIVYHRQPSTWYRYWVILRKGSETIFHPLPGFGHRWYYLLPNPTQLKWTMCFLLPALLWLDKLDRVLFLTWSYYVSLCPLFPTGLHQLPSYLYIKPKHLDMSHYWIIWRAVFTHPSLPFRS